jgi:protocatechuate 3,4-dioxygenase beta subunit
MRPVHHWLLSAAIGAALVPLAAHAMVAVTIRSGDAGNVWVASLPLGSQGALSSWEVPQGVSQFRAPIERGTQTLLCVGAADRATSCRRISVGEDSDETFTIGPGRKALGRCLLGRRAAAKAELRLSFAALQSQRPYSIPLARHESKIVDSVVTDSEGRFTFAHITPGAYAIDVRLPNGRIHRTAGFTIPERKSGDQEAAVSLGDISIPPGVDVMVRVRSSTGLPVKAAVGIWQERDANDEQPVVIEGNSDQDGTVVLSGATVALPLRVSCSAKGFVRASLRFDAPPREVTCILERFASLRGEIRDEKGAGRAGATVSIAGTSRRTVSEEHGKFVFHDLVAADYEVHATMPGYRLSHASVSVASGEDKETSPIELTLGDLIKGRVRDGESGLPVPNALVRIVEPFGAGDAASDDGGAFSLTADATVTMTLEASAAGYATVQQMRAGLSAAGSEVVIDMFRPGRLEVVVWDEEANEACAGCIVHAGLKSVLRTATTDVTGIATFESLTPGEYQVTRDFARASSGAVHVSGGGQWRSAVVKSDETTRVRIGEPAMSIAVTLTPAPPATWRLRATCPPLVSFMAADATGTYVVRKRDTECRLSLVDETRSTAIGMIPKEFQGSTFAMAISSGIVTATFVDKRGPISGASVQLTSTTGGVIASAITQSNGAFEIPFLNPGIYVVASPGIRETRTVSVLPGGAADAGRIFVDRP